jgi:ATP-binding cassette subfamily F protein uup
VLLVSHDRDFLDRVVTSVIVAEGAGRWQEYAGGYSDMLAQRGGAMEPRPAAMTPPITPPAAKIQTPRPAAPAPRRRLSFKEKQALHTLPGRIETLHATVARLRGALSDPGLYLRDRPTFERWSADLVGAESDLAAAEEEWLALEILREELEGS